MGSCKPASLGGQVIGSGEACDSVSKCSSDRQSHCHHGSGNLLCTCLKPWINPASVNPQPLSVETLRLEQRNVTSPTCQVITLTTSTFPGIK